MASRIIYYLHLVVLIVILIVPFMEVLILEIHFNRIQFQI